MSVTTELLEHWSLGQLLGVTQVVEGATNQVYRVECVDRVVFLRIYKRHDHAMALREHSLIRYVHSRGLPAPLPNFAIPATRSSNLQVTWQRSTQRRPEFSSGPER